MNTEAGKSSKNLKIIILVLSVVTFFVYYFSNPRPQENYDYTFRVADNVVRGEIGYREKPPPWLNEFVPVEGRWYSVFPLGSVLTMVPFALFKLFGFINKMPAAFISALTAGLTALFLLLIARNYDYGLKKIILFCSAILYGTWMWTNLTMAGAWQLALGFAVLGELGAIYFALFDRKPFLAGFFFALAFGNRTEILLTAPFFMVLLFYERKPPEAGAVEKVETLRQNFKFQISNFKSLLFQNRRTAIGKLGAFCAVPFVLGVATLIYNYVRFHSLTDFGYARIPGVLDEPWYNHGIFSVYYVPRQLYEMLLKPWEFFSAMPYLAPDAFSSSIVWSSPFLLLLFRFQGRDKLLILISWLAILILTILLWMHGNSGGWQFGYRYAMILLPWIFLILLENSPKKVTLFEAVTCALSFLINIYAVYLFHWTEYMRR